MARSRKTPKIGEIEYERLYDWSGGMNDAVNPVLLKDNESPLLENASLDEKGTLYPRMGSMDRYTEVIGNDPVTGLGAYYKSDGTSRLLIGAGTKLYMDNPHFIERYDLYEDFAEGEVRGLASIEKEPGKIVNDGEPPPGVTQTTSTAAQWNAGEKINIVVNPGGSISLAKVGKDVEHEADFTRGIHNNTHIVQGNLMLLYDDETGEYAEKGVWESPVIDLTELGEEASSVVNWFEHLPSKTAIFLQVRTSPDGIFWTEYQEVGHGQSLPPWEGYLQYRIILEGPHDTTIASREDDINEQWNEGELINVMAAGDALMLEDTSSWEALGEFTWEDLDGGE